MLHTVLYYLYANPQMFRYCHSNASSGSPFESQKRGHHIQRVTRKKELRTSKTKCDHLKTRVWLDNTIPHPPPPDGSLDNSGRTADDVRVVKDSRLLIVESTIISNDFSPAGRVAVFIVGCDSLLLQSYRFVRRHRRWLG